LIVPRLFHLTGNEYQPSNLDLDSHIHISFKVTGGPSEYAVHHSDREHKDMGVLKKRIEELYGTDSNGGYEKPPICNQNHRGGSYQLVYRANILDLII
jgi:hypothetical protein